MDFPDERMKNNKDHWGWVRVRDEGSRVTVTFKQVAKDGSQKTEEIEYEASSYEKAIGVFEAVGLKRFSEQETKRETWSYKDCEIMLDEWPWLKPYVEVEGPSEEAIKSVVLDLGFRWCDAVYGNADTVYRQTFPGMTEDETIGYAPEVTFAEMPQWLKDRR